MEIKINDTIRLIDDFLILQDGGSIRPFAAGMVVLGSWPICDEKSIPTATITLGAIYGDDKELVRALPYGLTLITSTSYRLCAWVDGEDEIDVRLRGRVGWDFRLSWLPSWIAVISPTEKSRDFVCNVTSQLQQTVRYGEMCWCGNKGC